VTDSLTALAERATVIDVITALFVETDNRNWPAVLRCLAPRVQFDMTSVSGGQPTEIAADEIVAAWDRGLRPMQAVHHQVGNFRIGLDGVRATASCYGVAFHYLRTRSGRNTRTFVGSYDFELEKREGRWRITLFRFNLKFLDGNLELEADAGAPEPVRV
jgi:3-phenylpropionate/cinnamic acid dioxygenase small subunit